MNKLAWADTEIMLMSPARLPMLAPRRNTMREVLTICFRDRRRIGLAFLLPFVAAVIVSLLPTPRYVSEATLLLRLGREYLYKPETGDANTATPIAYDREQMLHAEVEILKSRDVKEAAISKLGVAAIYPKIASAESDVKKQGDAALLELQRRFDAELLKDSNVVHMSFAHPDARGLYPLSSGIDLIAAAPATPLPAAPPQPAGSPAGG